jgi:uncharacterized protein (TIGR03437 family)
MQFYIRPVPTISTGGVVDAAQGKTPVAPGSYVTINGSGLSDASGLYTTASLPMGLQNVTVSFDVPSAGLSVPGRVIYVSPAKVNVQVPWELQGLPVGTSAQVKVTLSESEYGNVFTVPIADVSPAFFESGTGGARAVLATIANTLTYVTSSAPAKKGQNISLFANGLGPVSNQPASGDPAASASSTPSPVANSVTVTIGGLQANVTYAGLHPGTPGHYRIDLTVPAGIGSGAQTVSLSVAGKTATSTIYIQ